MKQRAAQVKAKSALNGVQKSDSKKTQQKELNPAVAEEVVAEITEKAAKNKKQAAAAAKVVPPKKVEPVVVVKEEEEDFQMDEEDSGADVAEAEGVEDMEEDEDEPEEDEEDDETIKTEVKNEEDSDDEEPAEEPISKKRAVKGTPGKINTGSVPADVPPNQIVFIRNMPKKFKQIDVVEVFAKYGSIHTINSIYREEGNTAVVAFHDADSAKAALAANNVAQIKGSTLKVNIRKAPTTKKQKKTEEKLKKQKDAEEHKQQIEAAKDRTLYVKSLKKETTEEQLAEHFAEFGAVESVRILTRKNFTFGFVVFGEKSEAEAGKKQHNSVLNGATIGVYLKDDDQNRIIAKDPKRTILIKNTQQLESLAAEKINTIFSKCGEIQSVDILCKKNVLAFVTFAEEEEAQKALQLSGTTVDDLELEIEEYKAPSDKPKTAVFVSNVKPGVTEDEIRALFANTGEIESVFLKTGFSIVRFKEVDAFCRSFLLNETILNGQMIFLEPYSEKKKSILKNSKPQFGKRRPLLSYTQNQKKFRQN